MQSFNDESDVPEPQLARASGRFGRSGWFFLGLGAIIGTPGLLLIIFGHSWVFALGLALLILACPLLIVATGLLLSSAVAHRAARHRPFA